jgi:hypothetical protein
MWSKPQGVTCVKSLFKNQYNSSKNCFILLLCSKRKQALLRSNLPAIRAWAMNKIVFVDRYRQEVFCLFSLPLFRALYG